MPNYIFRDFYAALFIVAFLMFFAIPALAQTEDTNTEAYSEKSSYDLIDVSGNTIGIVEISKAVNGILVNINAEDLSPGWRGLHLHDTGSCDPDTDFTSAGGHIMPENKQHGFLNPQGSHVGDLPNLYVYADGTARAEYHVPGLVYNNGHLFDNNGSALVIHANPDDYFTQPIGGAGARIACSELTKP